MWRSPGEREPKVPPVVDLDWWTGRRESVVLADVRYRVDGGSGREAYEGGHLPGAVFVDLDACLAGPAGPEQGRHPLPSPGDFADAMAGLGIGDTDTVVAYDDEGGVMAARLVWMLRVTGHDAALLDGGLRTWDGPLETGPVRRPRATFGARDWPADRLADLGAATDPAYVVLDARDADRYRGEREPLDPRAGHIPGALSLPCRDNLGPDGRFLPAPELRRRLNEAGVRLGGDVVSYCGSGVTACHNLLMIEHAGLGRGRLYPGSWSQYCSDPGRPAATGADPGADLLPDRPAWAP